MDTITITSSICPTTHSVDVSATPVLLNDKSGSNAAVASGSVVLMDAKPVKYKKGHHPNTLAALKPAKKGEVRNKRGITGPPLHQAIKKKLSQQAEELADKLFINAKSGIVPESTKAIEVFLKTEGGAYSRGETPQVVVNNNTAVLNSDDIQEILKQIKP